VESPRGGKGKLKGILPVAVELGTQSKAKMTRGNQRDLAREKAAKKAKNSKKDAASQEGNKGMSLEARKQRDAEVMRLKQEKAAALKNGGKS